MDTISEECGVDQAATGPAGAEPVVSVRGLVKRYGGHEAVAGIDLQVRRGEIFAFLGPNGAGKPAAMPAALRWFPIAGCGGMSTPAVVRSRCWCIRVNAGSARNTTTRLSSGSGHHLPCHPRSFHDGVETDDLAAEDDRRRVRRPGQTRSAMIIRPAGNRENRPRP